MPPKVNENFMVVYLNEEIEKCDTKVVTVPYSYVKNNSQVRYLAFPHGQEDKELINSFLMSKIIPPPPSSWVTYSCLVLGSYATLSGANNRTKKLLNDANALKVALGKAYAEKAVALPQHQETIQRIEVKEPDAEIIAASNELDKELENLPDVQGLNKNSGISTEALIDESAEISNNASQKKHENSSTAQDQSLLIEVPIALNMNNSEVPLRSESATEQDFVFVNKQELEELRAEFKGIKENVGTILKNLQLADIRNKNIESLLKNVESVLKKFCDTVKNDKISCATIMTKLHELTTFVTESRPLKLNENIITLEKFKTIHELIIPFEDLAAFDLFEQKLSDGKVCENLKNHFVCTISSQTDIEDTVLQIFKNFFKRAVLHGNYVAQKSDGTKRVFKNTKFYSCLKEACFSIFEFKFKENLLLQAIGNTITNSKDWSGGRKLREEKAKEKRRSLEEGGKGAPPEA